MYIVKTLESIQGKPLNVDERCKLAIKIAETLLLRSRQLATRREKAHANLMQKLMEDEAGKEFTVALCDQIYRSRSCSRAADQLQFLIGKYGIPSYLPKGYQLGLQLFRKLSPKYSAWLIPLIRYLIRKQFSAVVIGADNVKRHICKRRREGVRINLNHLGEAILGEEEAEMRLQTYLADLEKPEVDYVSVKISSICSQILPLARKETIEKIASRLRRLYRLAKDKNKFVNLDMEEYRDLALTVSLFKSVLEEPEFFTYSAGIVLQAYLPDAYLIQQELTLWALQRTTQGGAPIKLRLVKGANLAMEKFEALQKGWQQAPFETKVDVDANFKRMMVYGCQPSHAKAVHLGIASHNLFDISYALLLRSENSIEPFVSFEMLEGMADSCRRALQEVTQEIVLYCPVAEKKAFSAAVAYLIRRLDENTAPENFLRYLFSLEPNSRIWRDQASLFSIACQAAHGPVYKANRSQNRLLEPVKPFVDTPFKNEPDTDPAAPMHSLWAESIYNRWKDKGGNEPLLTTAEGIEKSFKQLSMGKNKRDAKERSLLLAEAAQAFRLKRGDLIGVMALEGKKTFIEADAEVSEAIDFIEYYRRQAETLDEVDTIRWNPKGIVLIASPWNFPCAIATGGIAAALATGNTALFKPAPQATKIGWELVQLFWSAGFTDEDIQFIACADEPDGTQLIRDPRIAKVILTGSSQTARFFYGVSPSLDLAAETGGKNSMIITALADRDLAIRDLLQSAFSHAGQKCSACSLAILEKEIYDDPHFLQTLKDAAASLKVGSPWDLSVKINPLIEAPSRNLLRGFTELDQGESWLLEPRGNPEDPSLWTPGIKLGVIAGSFTHQTELFGPVLGIMRAENLDHAIELSNATPYGLTAGLHSLDEREQRTWISKIEAGNLYINRSMTGAIVERQPFGGCKESRFGEGGKAGGPNYIYSFLKAEELKTPKEQDPVPVSLEALDLHLKQRLKPSQYDDWKGAAGSYAYHWRKEFIPDHDPQHLIGQANLFRYAPYPLVFLRLFPGDQEVEVFKVIAACTICRIPLVISGDVRLNEVEMIEESFQSFVKRAANGHVRLLHDPKDEDFVALHQANCQLHRGLPLSYGRVELLHYFREISVSIDYHRYGHAKIQSTTT